MVNALSVISLKEEGYESEDNNNQLTEKLEFLRFLVHDAVDFSLNELWTLKPDLAALKDSVNTSTLAPADICNILENQANAENNKDESDETTTSIIQETITRIKFAMDFFDYHKQTFLTGDVKDFVEKHKIKYRTISEVNSIVVDLFGCEFNTFTNAVLKSDQKNELSDEDGDLWDRVRRNDPGAINILVIRNLSLVHSVINRIYKPHHSSIYDYQDLFNEGVIGLRTGIMRFNPRLGFKLSTCAGWQILASVRKFISENVYELHYPVHYILAINKLKKYIQECNVLHGHNPTEDELVEMFNKNGETMSKKKIDALLLQLSMEKSRICLDAPSSYKDSRSKHEEISICTDELSEEKKKDLRNLIFEELEAHTNTYDFRKLGNKKMNRELALFIITQYFFSEITTLEGIAELWRNQEGKHKPYSREWIRQLLKTILKSLRSNKKLLELLESAVD